MHKNKKQDCRILTDAGCNYQLEVIAPPLNTWISLAFYNYRSSSFDTSAGLSAHSYVYASSASSAFSTGASP